jgi:hypothetical protein
MCGIFGLWGGEATRVDPALAALALRRSGCSGWRASARW